MVHASTGTFDGGSTKMLRVHCKKYHMAEFLSKKVNADVFEKNAG